MKYFPTQIDIIKKLGKKSFSEIDHNSFYNCILLSAFVNEDKCYTRFNLWKICCTAFQSFF